MSSTTMATDKRFTKHGFPKGFRFVPTNLELTIILSLMIHGRRLHPKVAAIFHELNILDYHPQELHDGYERGKEHRYIYFFSCRQHQRAAAGAGGGGGPAHRKRQRGAGGGQDEDENEPRPVRLAKGGGWKPSGGGHVLRWPKDKGGFVAGKMVTMVFYDHHGGEQVKSQWGMHEFTVPEDPRLTSKPTKTTRFHELALYRLYKIRSDDMESDYGIGAGSNTQTTPANVAVAGIHHFSAPCPAAGQPPFGIFTGRNQNQPLAAGLSTSRMPPPPRPQHHIPNVVQPHQYFHHQYGSGVAPGGSAAHQQRVHTMTTSSPAYATGMPPGRQLLPFARPPGRQFLPFAAPPSTGRQSLQFARPPAASSQMPVPLAAGNLAASRQQAPAKPMYGGAGQQASHSGATRSLPSAPVSMLLPAAESPSAADELAPMTAVTHGGDDFGATRSSPATGSRPAEQDATATAEAGQHVHQFAGCVQPEETMPVPPPIPADNYDGIGMLDLAFESGIFDENCLFTMDELIGTTFDEAPPTQQGEDN